MMTRSRRWLAVVAGVIIPAIGGPQIGSVLGQTAPGASESSGWVEAGSALRATQQGGRPTIVVVTSRGDAASQRLRLSLPGTLGRSFYLTELDAIDQAEWVRQIGITGLPGIAVYAHTETGIKLMGTMSGMADPSAVAAWVPTLWKPAGSNPAADPRVSRASYQQPSPQFVNTSPPAPAPSTPNYFVSTTPAAAPAPTAIPYYIYQQTASPAPAPAPAPTNYTTPAPAPMTLSPSAAPIVVNPPQQTIMIGPTPAPNIVAAAPAPAPAPTQYMMAAPAPAPAPVQMLPAPAPAPVQMVASAPVASSPVTQFVASAPVAVAAAPQNVVVAVRPLTLRNRLATSLGQLLIERNRPKFEVVQAANLAPVQGAPTFYAAQPQTYAPAPVCQQPTPQAPSKSEPLPALPSAQSQCPGCLKGGLFRHNHPN